jgi:hypothetical protein
MGEPMAGVFASGVVNQIIVGRDGRWSAGGISGRSVALPGRDGARRVRVGGGVVQVGTAVEPVCLDCLLRLVAEGADGLQEAGSDFGPPDQQERADGIEGGLAVGAGDQEVGNVESEGGDAGEDE